MQIRMGFRIANAAFGLRLRLNGQHVIFQEKRRLRILARIKVPSPAKLCVNLNHEGILPHMSSVQNFTPFGMMLRTMIAKELTMHKFIRVH